jgi:FAD/FMN-containing dehydrogenase
VGRYIQGVKQIAAEEGVTILTFGHLGDGNIHTNIMYDKSRQSQRQAVGRASRRILRFVLELEGSLSGEHGIGRNRRAFVHEQIGREQQSLMRRVKHVFDPNAILNPDKGY